MRQLSQAAPQKGKTMSKKCIECVGDTLDGKCFRCRNYDYEQERKDKLAALEAVRELLQEAVDTHFLEMGFAVRCRNALAALKGAE